MTVLVGSIHKSNAGFLLVLLPILLRFWYEAVIWRLEQGPQMLGYQVLHLSAGGALSPILAPLLLFSFLAFYVYLLWVLILSILWLIPKLRHRLPNVQFAIIGAISCIVFMFVAGFLQETNLGTVTILSGALVLTIAVLVVAWLIVSGFRTSIPEHNVAV